jgi:hypothetical protein
MIHRLNQPRKRERSGFWLGIWIVPPGRTWKNQNTDIELQYYNVYIYKQVMKNIRFFIEYETLHYHQ